MDKDDFQSMADSANYDTEPVLSVMDSMLDEIANADDSNLSGYKQAIHVMQRDFLSKDPDAVCGCGDPMPEWQKPGEWTCTNCGNVISMD